MKKILLFIAFLVSITINLHAQKIFPGAIGFGTDSRGAYAGTIDPVVLIVDDLSASPVQTGEYTGTFEWCLQQSYPRIIVFAISGVIDYTWSPSPQITIRNPYLNVYGQTSGENGITLLGCEIYTATHDILFQHVKFRQYDKNTNMLVNRCVGVISGSENVVFDHCSFSFANDELFTIWEANGDVTLSNSILSFPLNESNHEDGYPEAHGFCTIDYGNINVSYIGNIMAYGVDRFPLSDVSRNIMINNLTYASGLNGIAGLKMNDGSGRYMEYIVKENVFLHSSTESWTFYSADVSSGVNQNSKLWVENNICKLKLNNPNYTDWECVSNRGGLVQPSSPPFDTIPFPIFVKSEKLETYLNAHAGAYYWNRDYIDQMVIDSVSARTFSYINSAEPLPARAYNASKYKGLQTTEGSMENGYDFGSNNCNFSVNGTWINLDSNLMSQSSVISAISSQLPSGVEVIDHPASNCYHLIIQTTGTGDDEYITIGGDASVFGIANGTYRGHNGIGGYPNFNQISHDLINDLGMPTDATVDSDMDGYTDIEEWAYNLQNITDSVPEEPVEPNDSSKNIAFLQNQGGEFASHQDGLVDTLRAKGYNVRIVNSDTPIDFDSLRTDDLVILSRTCNSADILDSIESWGNLPVPYLVLSAYTIRSSRLQLINSTASSTSSNTGDLTSITNAIPVAEDPVFEGVSTNGAAFGFFKGYYDYIDVDSSDLAANNNSGEVLVKLADDAISGAGSVLMVRWPAGVTTYNGGVVNAAERTYLQIGSDGGTEDNYDNYTPQTLRLFLNEVEYLTGGTITDTVPEEPEEPVDSSENIAFLQNQGGGFASHQDGLVDTLRAKGYNVRIVNSDIPIDFDSLRTDDLVILSRTCNSADVLDSIENWGNLSVPYMVLSAYTIRSSRLQLINSTASSTSSNTTDMTSITNAIPVTDDPVFEGVTTNGEAFSFFQGYYDYIDVDSSDLADDNNSGEVLVKLADDAISGAGSVLMVRWPAGVTTYNGGVVNAAERTYLQIGSDGGGEDNYNNYTPQTLRLFLNEVEYLTGGGLKRSILSDNANLFNKSTLNDENILNVYPNPFNESTTFSYSIPQSSNVNLHIYSIDGKRVNTLINKKEPAGTKSVIWNGCDFSGNPLPTGIYFYLLSTDEFIDSGKFIIQR